MEDKAKICLKKLNEAEENVLNLEKELDGDDCKTYFKNAIETLRGVVLRIIIVLNLTARRTGIARVAGGILGVCGGALAIGGIVAAPFTLGTSLGLTFTGLGLTLGGSGTAIGSMIAKRILDTKNVKELKEEFEKVQKTVNKFVVVLNAYINATEAAIQFFSSTDGQECLQNMINTGQIKVKNNEVFTMKIGIASLGMGWTASKIIVSAVKVGKGVARVGALTTDIVIDGVTTGVKVGGRVLITSGGKVAVAFASIGAALSIVFGLIDIGFGARDIHMGNTKTQDIRKKQKEIEEAIDEILTTYHGILDSIKSL